MLFILKLNTYNNLLLKSLHSNNLLYHFNSIYNLLHINFNHLQLYHLINLLNLI